MHSRIMRGLISPAPARHPVLASSRICRCHCATRPGKVQELIRSPRSLQRDTASLSQSSSKPAACAVTRCCKRSCWQTIRPTHIPAASQAPSVEPTAVDQTPRASLQAAAAAAANVLSGLLMSAHLVLLVGAIKGVLCNTT